jgi:hypothetical protein
MPTYEDLRTYFDQSEELQRAVRAVAEIQIVSGFVLDVDPLWSLLYDMENDLIDQQSELRGGPGDRHDLFEYLRHFPSTVWRFGLLEQFTQSVNTRYQGYRRRNLNHTVKVWEELVIGMGLRRWSSPVNMTIVHRPVRASAEESITGTSDQEQLQALVRSIAGIRATVRVEERPTARFAFATGDEILAGLSSSGTLGGVLDDKANSKSYGVTCAHVAASGEMIKDAAGNVIGSCTADTTRVVLGAARVCDPVNLAVPNPSPGNGPDVNMLDCALIELTSPVVRQQLGRIVPALTQGQNVTVHGAKTGKSHHKLGSLCLSYSFSQAGRDYCFRDVIELLPQPRGPFGGPLGQMTAKVPSQGDSGAWVITEDQPADWAGVFFAEDGQRGFAIRSSWAHKWAETAVGATLTV